MFKIESYITPIILNYVGKFIKNFKPEQSQVLTLFYLFIIFIHNLLY